MQDLIFFRTLARTFLAGEPTTEQILERCVEMLGKQWRWLMPLIKRYQAAFPGKTRPRERDVVQFFRDDVPLMKAYREHAHQFVVEHWLTGAAGHASLPRSRSVGNSRDRVARRFVEMVGNRAGQVAMVCRSEGSYREGRRSAPESLSLSRAGESAQPSSLDRSAKARAQAIATEDSRRHSRKNSHPSGRSRICSRTLHQNLRSSACGKESHLADGSTRLLPVFNRDSNSGDVSRVWISRVRRRSVGRHLHECCPAWPLDRPTASSGFSADAGSSRPLLPPSLAARRTDFASPGESQYVSRRLQTVWVGRFCWRRLYPLCR